jgi:hypothetical protein
LFFITVLFQKYNIKTLENRINFLYLRKGVLLMSNTISLQEQRAQRVAMIIFDFHMKSRFFDGLNDVERLEILSDKIRVLKTQFKEKIFAQLVAKRLRWIIDDYIKENHLCPGCYHEVKYRPLLRKTYWQPEAGEWFCDCCGWSEAV